MAPRRKNQLSPLVLTTSPSQRIPRKPSNVNIKTEECPPPPPPPLSKDDTSDFESGSESDANISELTPIPLSKPVVVEQYPNKLLKQQTLISSYNATYKATIIRLLREDQEIQETLSDAILHMNDNNSIIQDIIKKSMLEMEWGDSTIRNNIKSIVLELLDKDTEVRDAIVQLVATSAPKGRTRAKSLVEPTVVAQPSNEIVSIEKRILAFLRKNTKTSITYEEFLEKIVITDEDLECILERGFVSGFTTLILRNLKNLELSQRPVVSFKRDTMGLSDLIGVYVKLSPIKWKRDGPPLPGKGSEDAEIGEPKWEFLKEIVFDFAQKVDIKITETRDGEPPEGWERESWNEHIDRIRKQASGGIDRIKLISDICRRVAEGSFVEI